MTRSAAAAAPAFQGNASGAAAHDEIGELFEAQSPLAEGGQSEVRGAALGFCHFPGALEAVDGGEGDFLLPGVLAGGLAEGFGGLFDVQDVVDDLEGQAGVL